MKNVKRAKKEEGFTLIELLVVILIIAILASVGIVALLGAIRAGQDSAAKQTLSKVLKEVAVLEIEQYGGVDIVTGGVAAGLRIKMQELSPDFTWQTTAITGDPTNVVSIGTIGDIPMGLPIFGVRSKSGKCLYLYAKPLSFKIDDVVEGSHLKAISKESYDTCPLSPVLNATEDGVDRSIYDTY